MTDAPDLTLWHAPLSRSMRVLWLLEEIGCPYRLELIDLTDGSTRRPPYDTIHPVGRAPQVGGARRARRGAWAGSTGCISAKPCASTWRT